MKDPSHRFLASRLLVHNQFMGFGNLLETIVHHLLIGGMTCFSRQNGFPMMGALVYMTHTAQDLW